MKMTIKKTITMTTVQMASPLVISTLSTVTCEKQSSASDIVIKETFTRLFSF